ncbi:MULTISPECIES: protein kinase domain-containing protein [unclassified Streptomyces]|uniref:protein kinase domain-containing protein n=1 Tax=unclassified Streptomyces TaxID=2593676 RepID=UPI002E14D1C9|nr:protein kinase [Streptomyces sp. NBC_01318]WSJ55942.1 protein kinase [Streptomyces sp. NBC_01318]
MEDVRELLAEYEQWREADIADDRERSERLADIVTALLRRSVAHAAVQPVNLDGERGVSLDFEGRDYLITFVHDIGEADQLPGRTISHTVREAGLTGRQGDNRWALLYWSNRCDPVSENLVDSVRAFGIVLDSSHLEAALAGLHPLAELIRDTFRQREAYVPLADLLTTGGAAAEAWAMTPVARLTSPLTVETRTWAGVATEMLLAGQAQQARPTGLAMLDDRTALITCPDGVLETDLARGGARWHLALPGCHGTPLIGVDGALLVMCGPAVVRWHQGQLSAVAGGFEPGSSLLPGPGQEAWVLSGSGVTFGAGQGSLALTRVGDRAGGQLRYPVTFEAAVCSATWLDRRRFFLAAQGHSAVLDLGRTTDAGRRENWILTPASLPTHVVPAGTDSVLSASPDGSGNRVALHRTHVLSRASEPVAEARLGEVFGLAQTTGTGPAYLLASLPDNNPTRARPVLIRVNGHRSDPETESRMDLTGSAAESYDLVHLSARGEKRDYKLDRLPFAEEGQAQVFRAEHKASGTVVAFKKRRGKGSRDARRMSREVAAAQHLGNNPHVMPVLDFSPAHEWFVMPMAEATVADRRTQLQDPRELRTLLDALGTALSQAHQGDWIHRDIKPANILLLDGRWTVADWGIARRPRGQTSAAGVLTNAAIGTEGFAAPELSVNGHEATPASDIYSIGQLIGWILTGTWPQANVPLLPRYGPWYAVVRQATQHNPAHRPQNIAAFLDLVARETDSHSELPIVRARRLLEDANNDNTAAAAQLLTLAADQPDSYELYLDVVTHLNVGVTLLSNVDQTAAVVRALTAHAPGDRGDWPRPEEAARTIWWLLDVARLAARKERWEVLDAAVQGMCDWDGRWDQWDPQRDVRAWMRTLTGHAATVVATALRAQPAGARHLHELTDDRRTDIAIRSAIHAATQG